VSSSDIQYNLHYWVRSPFSPDNKGHETKFDDIETALSQAFLHSLKGDDPTHLIYDDAVLFSGDELKEVLERISDNGGETDLAESRKGNLINPSLAAAVVSKFHDHFVNDYRIIGISDSVIARSMALADAHELRGYDAVQLGAALELSGRRLAMGAAPLTLVTGDSDLLAAATAEGLLTENPNIH
jgi:predicted nucleic acid-binding protein